jgi:predicted acylesterase/phospholipase RssA
VLTAGNSQNPEEMEEAAYFLNRLILGQSLRKLNTPSMVGDKAKKMTKEEEISRRFYDALEQLFQHDAEACGKHRLNVLATLVSASPSIPWYGCRVLSSVSLIARRESRRS